MKKLAIPGGRFRQRYSVAIGSVIAVVSCSVLSEGPHSAVADELSSGLPRPDTKPHVASIEQRPFFEMASLNLRTLVESVSDNSFFDGDLPMSRQEFSQAQRPAFSLATLNLRTFSPPEREVAPIHVIGDADAKRYRNIFELQAEGNWTTADALIEQLNDRVLMGHVLYQRYMHPTAYRSTFEELRAWLAAYADQPGADDIYRLANLRRPAGTAAPDRPRTGRGVAGAMESYGFVPRRYRSARERGDEERQQVSGLIAAVEQQSTRGSPSEALRMINDPHYRDLLDRNELDLLRADIAAGYFYQGEYKRAAELARISAQSDLPYLDKAHWTLGLSYWKLGDRKGAAKHFETVASSNNISPWTRAAGAFWAARSHEASGNTRIARKWLAKGAEYPGTFYGLLCAYKLGEAANFHWRTPALDNNRLEVLRSHPAALRGLALIQVGQRELAAEELRRIHPRGDSDLQQALVAIAEDAAMPDLAVRVGSAFRAPNGQRYDTALYPIPPWVPETGFQVDRALVFGFMRQESRFDRTAQSGVGASGLMQLMPRTAKYMGDDQLYDGSDRDQLFDPTVNIELGQRYLAYLLENSMINNDLLLLAASYNAGPGNVQAWRRRVDYNADPLFFIESIPIQETRDFIERVLTNFWVYRMRFNQPTPSLEAVANGKRPLYVRLDTQHIQVASHGRN